MSDSLRRLPDVFLNHFYLVLDSCTFKEIEQDIFLRRHFAINEQRTTVRTDQTYSGLYFYGTNTYFEFFDVANSPRPCIGDSGIAFGVEEPGASVVLRECKEGVDPTLRLITRDFQGAQVPWFFMATLKGVPYESGMSAWLMEYHPEFLANWNPQPNAANRGIRRSDILQRYSKVLGPADCPTLKDVIGLTLALDTETTANLVDFCGQIGYRIDRAEGEAVVLHGPDFVMRIVPASEKIRGIREIKMSVKRFPNDIMEQNFGRSTLKLTDSSATWVFQ